MKKFLMPVLFLAVILPQHSAAQDWPQAVRLFTQAQAETPYDSAVLFNLGFAHARSGHDLPACAWLHAYLAAVPDAANAEAVRTEIALRKASAWKDMMAIFDSARASGKQLSDSVGARSALSAVNAAQVKAGEMDSVQSREPAGPGNFGIACAEDGYGDEAESTAMKIADPVWQNRVWKAMVDYCLAQYDIEGANRAARKISAESGKNGALVEVRRKVIENTFAENAARCVFDTNSIADELVVNCGGSMPDEVRFLMRVAQLQDRCGDAKGKDLTIKRALKIARKLEPENRAGAFCSIAPALAEMEDIKGAIAAANELLKCGKPAALTHDSAALNRTPGLYHWENAFQACGVLGDKEGIDALSGQFRDNIASIHPSCPADAYAADGIASFYPRFPAAAYAMMAYMQALSGDVQGARRSAASAGEGTDLTAAAPVYAQLLKGAVGEALSALKSGETTAGMLRVFGKDVAFTPLDEVCRLIFYNDMKRGRLQDACEVVTLLGQLTAGQPCMYRGREDDPQWPVTMAGKGVIKLINAYAALGNFSAARAAVDLLSMTNPLRAEALEKLAEAQDKAGGMADAAKATRALVPASRWIAFAAGLSQDALTNDPALALKSASVRPDTTGRPAEGLELIKRTAGIGEAMGRALHKIIQLEKSEVINK
jgi:hypothetical protein